MKRKTKILVYINLYIYLKKYIIHNTIHNTYTQATVATVIICYAFIIFKMRS